MPRVPTPDFYLPPSRSDPSRSGLELGEAVDRFEEAWQQGGPPPLDQFLPPPSAAEPSVRRALLLELIPIDLEYRWRRVAAGGDKPWTLEEYLAHFSELGPLEQLPDDLIVDEYRVRQRWGDAPEHAAYAVRFASRAGTLLERLQRMDAQLAAEHGKRPLLSDHGIPMALPVPPGEAYGGPNDVPMAEPVAAAPTVNSVVSLVGLLRASQVLSDKQLLELGVWADRFTDPHALARHLVERSWLTPFQANQIFLGRGLELALGPYLLLERIGTGLTGEVFKARHLRMNTRLVALKVIRKELLQDADAVRRFYKEIEAAGRLSHPHVIHPYDAGPVGQTHFLAMEYVEGTDLARLVKESGRLPVAQACDYIRQAALGLQCVSDHGLVHRDIKPSNLMLERGTHADESAAWSPWGTVKILDLGLARVWSASINSSSTLTHAGAFLGTPDFMAPEQAVDPHGVDIRGDLYSLGCTFYYLLSGQPPFPGGTLIQKAEKHRWEEPAPIEELRPDLPDELARLLRRLMAKQPNDRPSTPAEVAAELAPWAATLHDPASADSAASSCMSVAVTRDPVRSDSKTLCLQPNWSPASPVRSRRRWLGAAAATLVMATGIILGYFVFFSGGTGSRPMGSEPSPLVQAALPKLPEGVSALDLLDPAQIPADERYTKKPKELVGMLNVSGAPARLEKMFIFFSPNGRWLVGVEGNELHLWDMATRKLSMLLREPTGPIQYIRFSRDSRKLMSVSSPPLGAKCLWDLETGKPQHRLEGGRVGTYSPDSRHYVCEDGKALVMYEVDTDREVRRFEGHLTGIRCVGYSDDGSTIATGAGVLEQKDGKSVPVDCTLRLWDATSGKELRSFGPHQAPVESVAFSGNGRRLYSHCTSAKGLALLRQWDAASGKEMCRSEGEPASPQPIFSPDGRWSVIYHNKKVPEAVDIDAGPTKAPTPLTEYPLGTSSAGFGPDNKTVGSIHFDGRVMFWDVTSGQRRRVLTLPAPGRLGNFSHDGRYFAASTDKGRIYIFRLADNGPALANREPPPGRSFLDDLDPKRIPPQDQLAGQPKELVAVLKCSETAHYSYLSPDGRWLVGTDGNAIHVLDIVNGNERAVLKGHFGPVRKLLFLDDGRLLMSGSDPPQPSIRLWNVETGQELHRVEGGRPAAYAPDGRHYACEDGKDLVLRDWQSGQVVRRFAGHTTMIRAVQFSRDGRRVATGAGALQVMDDKLLAIDCTVRLWDVDSGKELRSFGPHPGIVTSVALSLDGRRAIGSCTPPGASTIFNFWDLDREKCLRQLDNKRTPFVSVDCQRIMLLNSPNNLPEIIDVDAESASKPVLLAEYPRGRTSMRFAPDSKWLASCHADGRLILWDTTTGLRLRVFELPGIGEGPAYSSDGRHLAVSTNKGRAYIFRLTPSSTPANAPAR